MVQRLHQKENLPDEVETEAENCSSSFAAQRSTLSAIKKPSVNMAMEAKHKRVSD